MYHKFGYWNPKFNSIPLYSNEDKPNWAMSLIWYFTAYNFCGLSPKYFFAQKQFFNVWKFNGMVRKRSVIVFTFIRWFISKFMRNFALIALSRKVVNPAFQTIVCIKVKEFMRSDLFNEIVYDIISAYIKYYLIGYLNQT